MADIENSGDGFNQLVAHEVLRSFAGDFKSKAAFLSLAHCSLIQLVDELNDSMFPLDPDTHAALVAAGTKLVAKVQHAYAGFVAGQHVINAARTTQHDLAECLKDMPRDEIIRRAQEVRVLGHRPARACSPSLSVHLRCMLRDCHPSPQNDLPDPTAMFQALLSAGKESPDTADPRDALTTDRIARSYDEFMALTKIFERAAQSSAAALAGGTGGMADDEDDDDDDLVRSVTVDIPNLKCPLTATSYIDPKGGKGTIYRMPCGHLISETGYARLPESFKCPVCSRLTSKRDTAQDEFISITYRLHDQRKRVSTALEELQAALDKSGE